MENRWFYYRCELSRFVSLFISESLHKFWTLKSCFVKSLSCCAPDDVSQLFFIPNASKMQTYAIGDQAELPFIRCLHNVISCKFCFHRTSNVITKKKKLRWKHQTHETLTYILFLEQIEKWEILVDIEETLFFRRANVIFYFRYGRCNDLAIELADRCFSNTLCF